MDVLPDLFEAFAQWAPEERPDPKGLDLGLSLARVFAHHLKETLAAESEPGGGRVFTLRVPYHPGEKESLSEDGTQPQLLAVEENEVAQRVLHRILRDHYDVDCAVKSGEASQKAEATLMTRPLWT